MNFQCFQQRVKTLPWSISNHHRHGECVRAHAGELRFLFAHLHGRGINSPCWVKKGTRTAWRGMHTNILCNRPAETSRSFQNILKNMTVTGDHLPQFKKHLCFFLGQVGTGSRRVHLKYPRWSEIPTAWVAAGGSSPAQFLDSTCRWEHLGPLRRFGETGGILTTQRWWCALHIPLMIIMHLERYFGNWRTLMQAYNLRRRLQVVLKLMCKKCVSMPVWTPGVAMAKYFFTTLAGDWTAVLWYSNLQMEMSAERQLFMRSWLDDGWNWKAATLWESWWDRFATTDKSCWRGPAMSSLYRFLDYPPEI